MVCLAQIAIECRQDRDDLVWVALQSRQTSSHKPVAQRQTYSNIQPNIVVRDLGVYLDSELTMKQHIVKTSTDCFYHIRRLRQVRRRVGKEVLVMAFITCRLNYCNSLLAGLPRSTLEPLQRV